MKGELVLRDSDYDDERISIVASSLYDYTLYLLVDGKRPLEDEFKDREGLSLAYSGAYLYDEIEKTEDSQKLLKNAEFVRKSFENTLSNVSYVVLNFENLDDYDFIKNNPVLKDKKVVLSDLIKLNDFDKVKNLLDKYKDVSSNIYVKLMLNEGFISLNDAYKTLKILKDKAEEIMHLNMSPLENIMCVYDVVRNRVYKTEEEDESMLKSRDLSDVLLGDKIVCVGYANLFAALLTYMGIENRTVSLSDKFDEASPGHERNCIYVVDPKYDVDGVYYFDATWDSKKNNADKNMFRRYNFFAKTRNYMDYVCPYKDNYLTVYNGLYEGAKLMLDDKSSSTIHDYLTSMNYVLGITHKDKLDVIDCYNGNFDKDKILNDLKDSLSKFNKPLYADTYIKLLNNVRKKEYYYFNYPYSYDEIFKTMIVSDWKFRNTSLLLEGIFKNDFNVKYKIKMQEYLKNDSNRELLKDTKEVELTKVLKKVLENKKGV